MRFDFEKLLPILFLFVVVPPAFQLTVKRDDLGDGTPKLENNIDAKYSHENLQNHTLVSETTPALQIDLQQAGGAWAGHVYIGPSDSDFRVVFDTGSDALWVSGYKLQASQNGASSSLGYADGSSVTGPVVTDTVQLHSSSTTDVASVTGNFIAANVLPALQKTYKLQGILGMSAFVRGRDQPLENNFVNLVEAIYPNTRKFSFLPKPGQNGATLTVGDDIQGSSVVQLGNIVTLPLNVPAEYIPFWAVDLHSITTTAGANIATTRYVHFDTGSGLVTGPIGELAAIANIQGVKAPTPITAGGTWTSDCNFPDLHVQFGASNQIFVIPGSNLQAPKSKQTNRCRLLIDVNAENIWQLGVPFLKTVYSRFTIGPPSTFGGDAGYSVGLIPLPADYISSAAGTAGGGCCDGCCIL